MDADVTEKRKALAAIARQVTACTGCGLCRGRTHAVPGEGNPDADIVLIGEGPGFYEDQQARPFVGASGKFLDDLLRSIGLDRKTVFIGNVVKCRPPNNRDPQPDEIAACAKYLDAQLATIQPTVIVTLGRHSMQRYFPAEAIGRIHGQPRRKDSIIVVPMYHPAAALHQASLRAVIETDFRKLPDFLAKTLGNGQPAADAQHVPPHLRASVPANAQPSRPPAQNAAPEPAATQDEPQQMRLL